MKNKNKNNNSSKLFLSSLIALSFLFFFSPIVKADLQTAPFPPETDLIVGYENSPLSIFGSGNRFDFRVNDYFEGVTAYNVTLYDLNNDRSFIGTYEAGNNQLFEIPDAQIYWFLLDLRDDFFDTNDGIVGFAQLNEEFYVEVEISVTDGSITQSDNFNVRLTQQVSPIQFDTPNNETIDNQTNQHIDRYFWNYFEHYTYVQLNWYDEILDQDFEVYLSLDQFEQGFDEVITDLYQVSLYQAQEGFFNPFTDIGLYVGTREYDFSISPVVRVGNDFDEIVFTMNFEQINTNTYTTPTPPPTPSDSSPINSAFNTLFNIIALSLLPIGFLFLIVKDLKAKNVGGKR